MSDYRGCPFPANNFQDKVREQALWQVLHLKATGAGKPPVSHEYFKFDPPRPATKFWRCNSMVLNKN